MKNRLLKIVLCLLLVAAVPAFPQLRGKHALVIGLGEQLDPSWAKINGDKDIGYVVAMLGEMGYSDIATLKNAQATKRAITDAFAALAAKCREGDAVYVHYSGHGQLMTDVNGDESFKWSGKHSAWDEAWIPYDAYMTYCPEDRGEKHLCDDEVARCLKEIRKKIGKAGELVVVVDACHSGDATCGRDVAPVRGIGVRFCMPLQQDAVRERPEKEEWLTISACKPFQLNMEMNEPKVGKLTYALYRLNRDFLDKGNEELQRSIAAFMEQNKGRLPQTPMVTGVKKVTE